MKHSFLDENGYYGRFGGAYVPEILQKNISELKLHYLQIMNDPKFKAELNGLLHHYVGRPTPLYYATRLSKMYGTHIYLKREDLCHTGAHKLNNALDQLLLAKRMGKTRIVAETGAGQHGVATATAAAAGSIPYSDFKISANSFTSLTVRFTRVSASDFTSAMVNLI